MPSPVTGGRTISAPETPSVDELKAICRELEELVESQQKTIAQLEDALRTRDIIGQAMGILIERETLTSEEAFDKLKFVSQQSNVKLAEIAREVVERTTERPAPAES